MKPVYRAAMDMVDHDGLELAGYVAYTTIFSLFPFAIFLTALAGFIGSAGVAEQIIDSLFAFMPADVVSTLAPTIRDVLTQQQGGLLTFGIVFTLYSASSGIEALRMSLNRAYGTPIDPRPVWLRRLQSLAFVVVGSVALLLVALLIVAAPVALDHLQRYVYLPLDVKILIEFARYIIGALILLGALLALHRWLPCKPPRAAHSVPGIVITAALVLTGASLFSLYLSLAGNFAVTYGSLGGVMVTLLFFYVNALVFIFGAELNAALYDIDEKRLHPSERSAPLPRSEA